MKAVFSGFETPVELQIASPVVWEIENKVLFSRVVRSLASEEGEYALEPYTLWTDEGKEIKPKGALLMISDLINLPWDNRLLLGETTARLERLVSENEETRLAIEGLANLLSSNISAAALQFGADYAFRESWNMKRFLKAFGFGYDIDSHQSLIDNLICFIDAAEDAGLKKPLVFINIRSFLNEIDQKTLFKRLFFSQLAVLFLESSLSEYLLSGERKITIDQDYLEALVSSGSEMPIPLQKGFCPKGFGAVAF